MPNPYLDFKPAKCRDCYRCLRECPVKAIRYENRQATIMDDCCILCGHCTLVCPQNAKQVHSELDDIKALLSKGVKVVASVAPSFVSSFNLQDFSIMRQALKKLGFTDAEETSIGAAFVTQEYERLLKTKQYKNFITSACPATNRMIQLYYPKALKYLAPVPSPMIAHAKLIKEKDITLEVCPKSNLDTNMYENLRNHPIKKLYEMGLLVTLNTDNRTVSNTTLTKTYQDLQEIFSFTEQDFLKMNENAINGAFLNQEEKEHLLALLHK